MLLTSRKARIKDSLVEFVQKKMFCGNFVTTIRHGLKEIEKDTDLTLKVRK